MLCFFASAALQIRLDNPRNDAPAQLLAEHLAAFKIPRYVWFVESFPMTVTGKKQKFRMRELAIDDLGLAEAAGVESA